MADQEIMSDLLGDSKTDRTLEETVQFIAQKEQGKATQSAVGQHVGLGALATPSTHIKKKGWNTPNQKLLCWACGGKSHGPRGDRATRAEHCPAWAFTCNKCSVKGHYTSCCSKCSSCGSWGHRDGSYKFCSKTQRPRSNNRGPRPNYNKSITSNDDHVGDIEDDSAAATFDQLCYTSTSTCLGGHSEAPSCPP